MDTTDDTSDGTQNWDAEPAGSSSSSSASSRRIETASTTSEPETATAMTRARRRPIPKKGHTKSRRGCQNCKRRKVKCQETLPECANCKRLGLSCVYGGDASPAPPTALRTTPGTFNMEDLRFFHHFLVTAYPPLPMQADDVWKGVAALSHQYDYLVHSMLALAASHLNLYTGDCEGQALAHRVKAINLLNQSLNTPCTSTAEGDARFGAIMALTFQASCMPEGMTEFLSMIRGCHIIACTGMLDFNASLFKEFTTEGYSQSIRRLIGSRGLVLEPDQEALFDDFLVSLRRLAPLCSSPLEVKFLAATERITKMVKTSAPDAFAELASQYNLITEATSEELAPLIDTTSHGAQLLLIHFLIIEFAIGEIALGGLGWRFGFRRRSCLAWLDRLIGNLPERYMTHIEWPLKYAERMLAHLTSPFHLPNIYSAMGSQSAISQVYLPPV